MAMRLLSHLPAYIPTHQSTVVMRCALSHFGSSMFASTPLALGAVPSCSRFSVAIGGFLPVVRLRTHRFPSSPASTFGHASCVFAFMFALLCVGSFVALSWCSCDWCGLAHITLVFLIAQVGVCWGRVLACPFFLASLGRLPRAVYSGPMGAHV